jgi:hypothetical protein
MVDKMIENYFVVNHFVFLVAARPRGDVGIETVRARGYHRRVSLGKMA